MNNNSELNRSIISLIKKEVVPAIGCTEPMAVALCTARATEDLGKRPSRISVLLSANMLKNAMGVGIPGTGMIGLPIAIALGALCGKSKYQLEVLRDLTPDILEEGKKYIAGDHIDIKLKENITEKLYIEVTCEADGEKATAIIAGGHTNFVYEEACGKVLLDKRACLGGSADEEELQLTLRMVWDFATTAPLDDIRFILQTRDYNIRAAEESKKGNYGHCLGKTIDRPLSHGIFGKTIFSHIISETALACDARMGGAMIPVMSNSGSGNQGICATNPVAVIVYLMGGDFTRVCHAVKNMIANLTGMICDGAKPSCSIKICSGVSSALLSALLSMEGEHVTAAEGIIDEDVDKSIHNLTSIGKEAMCSTDDMVLNIMTHKGGC